MKKIKELSVILMILVALLVLVGCGSTNYLKSTDPNNPSNSERKDCHTDGHAFELDKCTVCGATYSDNLVFELSDDESSYIVLDGQSCKDETVIIPAVYNGKPVTEIADGAFYYCETMKKVKIPASVVVLREGAFHRSYNLETVEFEEGSQLKKIGDSAFLFCDKLRSINFPEGLLDIGKDAFLQCYNLKEIVLPDGLLHIGINAFTQTGYFRKDENWKNGLTLYIGNHFIALNGTHTGAKFIVDEGTRVIADGVFLGCTNMRNIEIPSSVTSIGSRTFEGCTKLEYVNIQPGSQLQKIHAKAFLNCEKLLRVNFAGSSQQWALIQKEENWVNPEKNFKIYCTDGYLTET